MSDKTEKTKLVRFDEEKWDEHRGNADRLAKERGLTKLALADYLNEAAKHFEYTRPRTTAAK